MRILIEATGSHGDMLPFFRLAAALEQRGHDAHVYGNERFAGLADESGIAFTVTSGERQARAVLDDGRVTDRREGLRLVAAALLGQVDQTVDIMRRQATSDCVVVGSSLGFASRLLAEATHLPFAAIHLAPSLYRSDHLAPRISPLGHFGSWPRWCKRVAWRAIDRRFLDPLFCAPLNRICVRMGLPAVRRVMHSWIHDGAVNIGAFPEWFAPRQPDWPTGLRLTGFPRSWRGPPPPLPADLEAFLSREDRPLVFTAGTANTSSQSFYAESAAACALLGRRGLLVAQRRAQLPAVLPAGVVHAAYAPFDALFPRAAAVVHHGGIGTLSEALAAGVPQLIQPMAFDQFDNASRANRLGVARELLPRRYRADRVARCLDGLLADSRTGAACESIRSRMRDNDGLPVACDLIEAAPGLHR